MDSLTLAAVAAELRRRAVGTRLGRVFVPQPEQLAIGLATGGLFVSIRAADARVHTVAQLPAAPRAESGLQAHLDGLLGGGELHAVAALRFDRVLELTVDNLTRVGEPVRYRVVIELMGKHSACTVVGDDGLIVATLKPVTRAVNRHRELLPKVPYVSPPDGGRTDPLTLDRAAFERAWPQLCAAPSLRDGWRRLWFGLSDELWQHLCHTAGCADAPSAADADACARLWAAWAQVQQVVAAQCYQPHLATDDHGHPCRAWPLPFAGGRPVAEISTALAAVAAAADQRQARQALRAAVLQRVKRRQAQVAAGLRTVAKRAQRAAEADDWQMQADLILANLHRIAPRAESFEAVAWHLPEAPTVVITLDPGLPPARHAESLYIRARKARAGGDVAAEHTRLAAEADELAHLADAVRQAPDEVALRRLSEQAPPEAVSEGHTDQPRTERERILRRLGRVESSDGYTILVGRSSTDSEALLSRIAAPTDLWFHVRGAGSGHVIVRTGGQPGRVPQRTIEEAALQAARCSKMKHSEIVPVVYTQRKHVTKIKGGQAGKVVYRHEKAIFVNPQAS